jgi:hypothetical protein
LILVSFFLLGLLVSVVFISPVSGAMVPSLEADVSNFEPVGQYGVVTSNFDNIAYDIPLLLTVSIDLLGVNDQSPYYNDTITESIYAIEVSIVEAGYSQKVNLQPELMMTNTNYTMSPPYNPVWEANTSELDWDFNVDIPDIPTGSYTLRVTIYFLYLAFLVFPTDVYTVDFIVPVIGRVIGPATEVDNLDALLGSTPIFVMVALFSIASLGLNVVLLLISVILWRKVRKLGVS